MKPNQISSALLTLVIFIFFPIIGYAQGLPTGCPDPDPNAPCVPIDGGVSLLIAAGVGIGARKAYQERNKAKALAPKMD